MKYPPIPERAELAAKAVVNGAYRVHSKLGPGLLESVYEACLCHELQKAGMPFKRQAALPVIYDDIQLDAGLRIDIWVDECLIVELKSVEEIHELHKAQVLTYLKLTKCRLGLLINFNVPLIKDGVNRFVL